MFAGCLTHSTNMLNFINKDQDYWERRVWNLFHMRIRIRYFSKWRITQKLTEFALSNCHFFWGKKISFQMKKKMLHMKWIWIIVRICSLKFVSFWTTSRVLLMNTIIISCIHSHHLIISNSCMSKIWSFRRGSNLRKIWTYQKLHILSTCHSKNLSLIFSVLYKSVVKYRVFHKKWMFDAYKFSETLCIFHNNFKYRPMTFNRSALKQNQKIILLKRNRAQRHRWKTLYIFHRSEIWIFNYHCRKSVIY